MMLCITVANSLPMTQILYGVIHYFEITPKKHQIVACCRHLVLAAALFLHGQFGSATRNVQLCCVGVEGLQQSGSVFDHHPPTERLRCRQQSQTRSDGCSSIDSGRVSGILRKYSKVIGT